MSTHKIGYKPFIDNTQFELPNEERQKNDLEFSKETAIASDERKEEALENERKNERSLDDKDDENFYDLDLKIKETLSLHYGIEPGLSGNQCGPQSEWPRCSRPCTTQRGHTCPSCDTQQQKHTCIRC
jgi:hypothetical protein